LDNVGGDDFEGGKVRRVFERFIFSQKISEGDLVACVRLTHPRSLESNRAPWYDFLYPSPAFLFKLFVFRVFDLKEAAKHCALSWCVAEARSGGPLSAQ
jgi:hypothetical protein